MGSSPPRPRRCWGSRPGRRSRRRSACARTDGCSWIPGTRDEPAGHRHPRSPPGGAGLVEAALIGGLIGAGRDKSQVAAAVLIYRALTWALSILVGITRYVWWRRSSIRPGLLTADGPPVAG